MSEDALALSTLAKTDGVYGAALLDPGGTCLVNHLRPPHDAHLLSDVVKRLFLAFDVFSSLDEGAVTSFFVECEDGSLILRRVDHRWLVALTSREVNMSMLNLAMNVVALNLNRGGTPGGGAQAISRGPMDSSVERPGASQTLSSTSAVADIPADAVDRSIVQRLLVIYTDYLGPAAKLVFKQQLAALAVTSRTLPRARVSELVTLLAARIPVQERRGEFAAAVREYRERMLF